MLFTGKLFVDGVHMQRPECGRQVERHGGSLAPDRSRSVTLLVHGEQGGRRLTDPNRGYSQKLVFAEREMREGRIHIHVIDGPGFEALLHGRPADCHRLRVGVADVVDAALIRRA